MLAAPLVAKSPLTLQLIHRRPDHNAVETEIRAEALIAGRNNEVMRL